MESKKGRKEIIIDGIKGVIEITMFKEFTSQGVYTNNIMAYVGNSEEVQEVFNEDAEQPVLNEVIKAAEEAIKKGINDLHYELQKPIIEDLKSMGFEIGGEESVVEGDMIQSELLEEKGHTSLVGDEEFVDSVVDNATKGVDISIETKVYGPGDDNYGRDKGLEEFDEDHALDMVMNDIIEDLGEEEINEIIEEAKKLGTDIVDLGNELLGEEKMQEILDNPIDPDAEEDKPSVDNW